MLQLIPLSQTQIDWANYLKVANDALDRSPTAAMDEHWQKLTQSLSDYIATLREIESPGRKPLALAGAILCHVHIAFMLIAPKNATYEIILESKLDATPVLTRHNDFVFSIISGNLSQWRTAILNCSANANGHNSANLREFSTSAYEFFSQLKLAHYMLDVKIIPMHDGTVRMIEN